jgi:hypothetical protein
LQLHATCNCLWLDLEIFVITRPNFNYFGHSHTYDATIEIFILLVGWILGLFSSISRLICPINHNNHQITYILKVFYNDIVLYFNVCIEIIFMIYLCVCICMHIVHIMNLEINIWTLKFVIQIWNLIFHFLKTLFEFDFFQLNIIFFYLNFKSLIDLKFDIWILNYYCQMQK